MARRYVEVQVINQLLDNSPTTSTSSWYDVGDFDKVTLCLVSDVTAVGASPQVTYTVQTMTNITAMGSDGQPTGTARTYDKLLATGGTDAPVASVVHSADATAFVSLSPEDAIRWIRVVATGANTDADDTVQCNVILMGKTST